MNKTTLIIVLIISSLFAACSGKAHNYLPAVVGDQGTLVNMTIILMDGNGDAFISVYPKIGLDTQQSLHDALDYSFSFANRSKNECDALVKVYLNSESGYLDGPSGGAALTLMSIAALENKPMRSDATITGTINEDGSIGNVGGVYEKAKIAKQSGLAYFLTPPQGIYDRIMLRPLKDENFTILEVENISQAESFLMDGKNITQWHRPPHIEAINSSLEQYAGERVFTNISYAMMDEYAKEVSKIDPNISSDENLGPYFEQIMSNDKQLMDKGYEFTAANDAFLNYLDAKTIANYDNPDVGALLNETRACFQSLDVPNMTDKNYEWVSAIELREGWARQKMDDVNANAAVLKEERLAAYHDLMYTKGWCIIADTIAKNAPQGGNAIDENKLRNLSDNYISKARLAGNFSSDLARHLDNAIKLNSQGDYGGAIMDSVYVIEMANSSAEASRMGDKLANATRIISQDKMISFWAKAYYGHGQFMLENGNYHDAYGLFAYSNGLDEAMIRMKMEFAANYTKAEAENGTKCQCLNASPEYDYQVIFGIVIAVVIAAFVFMLVLRQKKDGPKKLWGAGKKK